MASKKIENFLKAVNHEQPDQVPVMVYDTAPWSTTYAGVRADRYYFDSGLRFKTQWFHVQEFPEAWLLPGIWPEFTVLEPAIFGCPITWYADSGPHVHPIMEDIHDVLHMKLPDPLQSPVMQTVLAQYEYMRERVDARLVEGEWYLKGCPIAIAPFELAAQLRGYGPIMIDTVDYPQLVHQLLELCTETTIRSLKIQDEMCGGLRVAMLADHNTANLSARHCAEFLFPYLTRVIEAFPDTIMVYHNEAAANHVLDQIGACGAEIFHCGVIRLAEAKARIGDKICLMGNVHTWNVMVQGSVEDVRRACQETLDIAAPGGGFILTTGGGHDPSTPKANIRAMVESAVAWKPN